MLEARNGDSKYRSLLYKIVKFVLVKYAIYLAYAVYHLIECPVYNTFAVLN